MSASSFEAVWKARYPGAPPIGYTMREARTPHWLRFHSLPQSKRYAETAREREIILARQNHLAGEVLGVDQPCWLVQAGDDTDVRTRSEHGLRFIWSFIPDDADEDNLAELIYAAPTVWRDGAFDSLLLEIADDSQWPTLWMSLVTGAVFAPYDGGVDLFLASEQQVLDLKHAYADWLPGNSRGL